MAIFLVVVITLLGLIHWFLYARLVAAFSISSTVVLWTLRGLAAYLSLSYVLARFSERHLPDTLVHALHWIASVWIGLMWQLLWITLVFFVVKVLLMLTGVWGRLDPALVTSLGRWSGFTVIGAAVLLCGVGAFIAFRPAQVVEVKVPVKNITPELRDLRIAMASDFHAGVLIGRRQLTRIMDRIMSVKPDLVLLPGDIVDAEVNRIGPYAPAFHKLIAPLGVFATTGNHEYYAGLQGALEFYKAANLRLLMNEWVELPNGLVIAGIEDRAGAQMGRHRPNVTDFLKDIPAGKPVLLLDHTPEVREMQAALDHGADAVLCGHTHAGQLWPFSLLTRMTFLYHWGIYPGPRSGHVLTSSGIGYWGPPMRLGAPSEVVLIRLVGENEPASRKVL